MSKSKNLFLYLAVACFLGLVLIFVFDGYMGTYDTLWLASGEYPEQEFQADFWLQRYAQASVSVSRDGKVSFRYEVDNRRFSAYTEEVDVSVWQSQEKVTDVVSRQLEVPAFGKQEVEWSVDTSKIVPSDAPAEQSYQYTVVISRGEVERKVYIYVSAPPVPTKVVPPPVS